MVNPLMSSSMSAKMEPLGHNGMECGVEESSSSLVKMELELDSEATKAIKIEAHTELEDLLGLALAGDCGSGLDGFRMSDSDSKESLIGGELLLPGPQPASYSVGDSLGGRSLKLNSFPVKVGGGFPPVLSIPGAPPGTTFVVAPQHIEISVSPAPSSQGPDTTTLTSPPPSLHQHHRKTTYTAKGIVAAGGRMHRAAPPVSQPLATSHRHTGPH
jgi:hypothetical protein